MKLLREVALKKTIASVETTEDTIVFSGVSHNEFVCHPLPVFSLCVCLTVLPSSRALLLSLSQAKEVQGRVVDDVQRYGTFHRTFWREHFILIPAPVR